MLVAWSALVGCGEDKAPESPGPPERGGIYTGVNCPSRSVDSTRLSGRSLAEGMRIALRYDHTVRVVIKDGDDQASIANFDPRRINVATRGGRIDQVFGRC